MPQDRLLRLRDLLVGDRRFQRWAARFPLTRPIARRRTADLFDLCAGFVYSQALFACVQLQLFALVAAQPRTAAELAACCDMPEEAMQHLLTAVTALDLLSARSGGRFGLGGLGAAVQGNAAISAMIAHHAALYKDLADPVAMLRLPRGQTLLGAYWGYATHDRPETLTASGIAEYTALMRQSLPMIADEVLAAHDFRGNRCLLDVGGGDGGFVEEVARQAPHLRLMLLDLPAVADAAATRLAAAGLGDRVCCHGGGFATDAWPQGADIISFVRVLHDHDDATVRILLAKARAALPPGGTVLIAEPMADSPRAAAYFSLYLHAMGSGRPRSTATLTQMLGAAGFRHAREVPTPTPLLTRIMRATVSLD